MIEKAACFICAVPVYSRILAKYGGFRYDTGMSFVFPRDLHGFRIHMVGIKGTGMAALTEILCARGACVSGSDTADSVLFILPRIRLSQILTLLRHSAADCRACCIRRRGGYFRRPLAAAESAAYTAKQQRQDSPELSVTR